MLKWVGGCAVILVLAVAIAMFAGYQKIRSVAAEGPAVSVVIHAPAERVFASLAHADSLTEWRAEGLGIRTSRRGLLQPGDTLILQTTGGPAGPQRSTWVVTTVVPPRVVAMEARGDTSGTVLATRRDSVVALGDSALVVTTMAAAVLDSLRVVHPDSGRPNEVMLDVTSNIMVSAMRLQSGSELRALKRRIEGDTLQRAP